MKKLGWLLLVVGLSGCIKIDSFDEPHSMEAYTGPIEVDTAIEGLSAGARETYIISISSDPTGEHAYISGLPPQSPFYIIPQELWKELREKKLLKKGVKRFDLPPSVAGLETEVVDRNTLKVIGFQTESTLAKKLGLTVTGELVREGAQAATTEDIVISANVGKLKAMLPKILLDELYHHEENKTISEMDDNKQVNLYRYSFRGDIITAF